MEDNSMVQADRPRQLELYQGTCWFGVKHELQDWTDDSRGGWGIV